MATATLEERLTRLEEKLAKLIEENPRNNGAEGSPITVILEKRGDSGVLVLDKVLLDALGITPGTPVRVSVQNEALTVSPIHEGFGVEKVVGLLQELRPAYKEMLENLAK